MDQSPSWLLPIKTYDIRLEGRTEYILFHWKKLRLTTRKRARGAREGKKRFPTFYRVTTSFDIKDRYFWLPKLQKRF